MTISRRSQAQPTESYPILSRVVVGLRRRKALQSKVKIAGFRRLHMQIRSLSVSKRFNLPQRYHNAALPGPLHSTPHLIRYRKHPGRSGGWLAVAGYVFNIRLKRDADVVRSCGFIFRVKIDQSATAQ